MFDDVYPCVSYHDDIKNMCLITMVGCPCVQKVYPCLILLYDVYLCCFSTLAVVSRFPCPIESNHWQ